MHACRDSVGDEILHQATDKTIRGITGAERVLAWFLRLIVPILMLHIVVAFLLAIILNPYTILCMHARTANTVWKVSCWHLRLAASCPMPRACIIISLAVFLYFWQHTYTFLCTVLYFWPVCR
jgi:hypothetical protein